MAGRTTPVVLELADLDSLAECADTIDAMGAPIDILICNAGVLFAGLRQARGICLTPGPVRGTNILRHIAASSDNYPKSPAQGAATQCSVETHPADVSGRYFADCNPAEQSEYQQDEAMAARLWAVSEELAHGYI